MATREPSDHVAARQIAKFLLDNKRRASICYDFCRGVPLEFMNCPAANGTSKPLLDILVAAYFFATELLQNSSPHYDKRQELEDFLEELELIRPFVRW